MARWLRRQSWLRFPPPGSFPTPCSRQDVLGPQAFFWLLNALRGNNPLGLFSLQNDLFLSPSKNWSYGHMFGFEPSDLHGEFLRTLMLGTGRPGSKCYLFHLPHERHWERCSLRLRSLCLKHGYFQHLPHAVF